MSRVRKDRRLNVFVSKQVGHDIDKAAEERGKRPPELVRNILEDWLNNKNNPKFNVAIEVRG